MNCQEHERLFEKYFDREISALEYKAMRSHLGRCSECREAFLDHLLTMDFLSVMPMEEPSEQLTGKILRQIPEPNRRPEWRRWATGIAACAILAVSLTIMDRMTSGSANSVEATLSNAGGKIPYVARDGRIVLPRGTVLKGNLVVKGDLVILGKVYGDVHADRIIRIQPAPADPLKDLWTTGRRLFWDNKEKSHQ